MAHTFRVVREDQKVDAGGPCPRSKDGDALGVTPKVGNVLTEPAQGLNLVQEAVVAFRSLVSGAEKAWKHRRKGASWGCQSALTPFLGSSVQSRSHSASAGSRGTPPTGALPASLQPLELTAHPHRAPQAGS